MRARPSRDTALTRRSPQAKSARPAQTSSNTGVTIKRSTVTSEPPKTFETR